MWRTACKPRWLALLALVLAVMAAFAFLGRWQLDVARDTAAVEAVKESAARPPVPVREVIGPHEPFPTAALSRVVTATGSYRPSDQLLISERRLGERTGVWVVDALVLDDGGAVLPVLRGFVEGGAPVPSPPAGRVTVVGALAVGEPSPDDPRPQAPGHLQRLSIPMLVNRWHGELFNAFVFADREEPAPGTVAAGLTRVPPPAPESGGLAWRNLGYALQWWFFAAFALYMWWRMVREDAAADAAAAQPPVPDPDRPDPDRLTPTTRNRPPETDHPKPTTRQGASPP